MKLFDQKRLIIIIISIVLGLAFGGFLIYDQLGYFGATGYIALGVSLVISLIVILVMIKIGNTDD